MSPAIFSATMTVNRYCFLHSNIRFDDANTRQERISNDKFTAFRDIYECFNAKCSSALQPDEFIALDETLYACRNRMSFKQYNPKKTRKIWYPLQIIEWSKLPIYFLSVVYEGKPENEGEFYHPGIIPVVKHMVSSLMRSADLRGRNITMDRLYTSLELSEWLLEKKITTVGTIMSNKKGIPKEIKTTENREKNSYEVYWLKNNPKISLHSYVIESKSRGKTNVLVLSSMPAILGTTRDDGKNKPAIIKFYDFSKGGTDIVDQRISSSSVSTTSRRWTMSAFSYVLDTARINAQTIFSLNNDINPRKSNSLEFGWQLAMSLVKPHIMRRKKETLSKLTINKINCILLKEEEDIEDQNEPAEENTIEIKANFCKECLQNCYGPNYRIKKKSIYRIKTICTHCKSHICKNHMEITCKNCNKNR